MLKRTRIPLRATAAAQDNLLIRWAQLRTNLLAERSQEATALSQGLLLPIRATRRAAMLERALQRNRQLMLALPL